MPDLLQATPEMAIEYARWFVNRRAYTPPVGSAASGIRPTLLLPPAESGGNPLDLTPRDIQRHLAGEITLGIYAINPQTQRVKWMAIDADYRKALEDLLKLQYELGRMGIQAALEQSRRGGHLWIFFEKPVLAKHARVYIRHLAKQLSVRGEGFWFRRTGSSCSRSRTPSTTGNSGMRSEDRWESTAPRIGGTGSTVRLTNSTRRWRICGICDG